MKNTSFGGRSVPSPLMGEVGGGDISLFLNHLSSFNSLTLCILVAILLILCQFAFAQENTLTTETQPQPEAVQQEERIPPPADPLNFQLINTQLVEKFRIRIVNDANGEIAVSSDSGVTWRQIGRVLAYTQNVGKKGFTASKWIQPGHVTATAVNAIHFTTDYNPETDRGVVFSLIPKGIVDTGRSYYSASATIITNFQPGAGIFGGGFAPLIGNRVYFSRGGDFCPLEKGYVPARGDRLMIIVEAPAQFPIQMVFQNREGGVIYLQFPDASRKAIGRVVRPVHGVGRFSGTQFADVGRIRANHPGVIDVSCSIKGKVGGFQIVPLEHSYSPEMKLAWQKTQWMVVAPLSPDERWEGTAPLFYQYLRPNYYPAAFADPDWQEKLLSNYLVEVQHNNGMWGPCPAIALDVNKELPEWADSALGDVTAVRILFPVSASNNADPGE